MQLTDSISALQQCMRFCGWTLNQTKLPFTARVHEVNGAKKKGLGFIEGEFLAEPAIAFKDTAKGFGIPWSSVAPRYQTITFHLDPGDKAVGVLKVVDNRDPSCSVVLNLAAVAP